jgi:DNA-binding CsgD family transcriptional regulator
MTAVAVARPREPAVQSDPVRLAIRIADPVLRAKILRALAGTDIAIVGDAGDADRFDAVLTDAVGEHMNWFAAPDEARAFGVNLTARERDVLAALADGASNKVIARRLGISFHTAKFHVAAIMAKLDADSRTEAVAKAAHLGLVML